MKSRLYILIFFLCVSLSIHTLNKSNSYSKYQPPKGSDKAEFVSGLDLSKKTGSYYKTTKEEFIETTRFVLFLDKDIQIPINVIDLINHIMDLIEEETQYQFYAKKPNDFDVGVSFLLEQFFDNAETMKKVNPTKVGIVVCDNQDGPYAVGEKGILLCPENIRLLVEDPEAIIHELLHVVFYRNGKGMEGAFDEGFSTYYTERIVKKKTQLKNTYNSDLTNYTYAINEKTMEQLYIVNEQGSERYKLGYRLMHFIIEEYGDNSFRLIHEKVSDKLDENEYEATTKLIAEVIKKELSEDFFVNFSKWHKINRDRFGDRDISEYGEWRIDHEYLYKYYGNETHVFIPNDVVEIGHESFAYNQSILSVIIPNSVTAISGGAFFGCRKLKEIIIPNSVTLIYSNVFRDCSNLEKVVLPNRIKEIPLMMFTECTSLNDISLPNSIKIIDDYAFAECSSLETINIPENVEKIGESAFRGCSNLERINLPDNIKEASSYLFNNCSNLKDVVLPRNLKNISYGMFWHCRSLEKITIPYGVTTIGQMAFSHTGIRNIKIPESVTEIESGAFMHCINLKIIEIPESVIYIGDDMFYGCKDFVIIGKKGSYADSYAKKLNITFAAEHSSPNRMRRDIEKTNAN